MDLPTVARRWAVQYVQQPIVPAVVQKIDVELETAFVKFMFQAITGRRLPRGVEPI